MLALVIVLLAYLAVVKIAELIAESLNNKYKEGKK